MKTCTRCGLSKPESEFYRQRAGHEARQSRCKACDSVRWKQRRQRDLKTARRIERQRYHARPRKPLTPDQQERQRLRFRQGCHVYKPQRDAHGAVRVACRRGEQWASNQISIRRQGGLLFRPPHCPWCGQQSPLPIEVHHYLGHAREHWLDETIWVCRTCHRQIEVLMREAQLDGLPSIEGFKRFLREHGVRIQEKHREPIKGLPLEGYNEFKMRGDDHAA